MLIPKPRTRFLFLALLVTLASASWWAHYAALFSSEVTLSTKEVPKFFLNEVASIRFNQSGEIKSILEFDSLIQLESKNEAQLIQPTVIFHNNTQSTLTVTSDAGIIKNNEKIDLMGNVTLKLISAESSAPTSIATDFAIVEIHNKIARTNHKTTITRQSLVGFSHGFIYHAQTGLLDLLSNVTMTYDD